MPGTVAAGYATTARAADGIAIGIFREVHAATARSPSKEVPMRVRRIARPQLAAPFVYGGISTLRKPQDRVPGARPVVEKIAETADKQLPVEVPKDVEQWVKVDAAVKVAAGSLFALNKFPRLTAPVLSPSIVPTTLAGHRFWEHDDPTDRFGQVPSSLRTGGLLGGRLLSAVDTEDKPAVGDRARRAAKRAADSTEKSFERAQKRAAK